MDENKIRYAVEHTEVLINPKRSLSTFGTTNIQYFLLTEPIYEEFANREKETVIREGKVIAEKPKIITPSYLLNLEGFSPEARQYFEMVRREVGPHAPGLLYSYKNEPPNLTIVSEDMMAVAGRLKEMIEREDRPLTAVLKGVDELWDISLLKFISTITRQSMPHHMEDIGSRGFFEVDRSGLPGGAKQTIEELFTRVKEGTLEPWRLKSELDSWGIFEEYQDRFLTLFRRKQQ